MNCADCGGPMRLEEDKEYLVCDYCGSTYYPDPNPDGVRVLGESASEACPVCAVPLSHAAVAGERIRYCGQCHGMLIPMGVFVNVIEDLRAHRNGAAGSVHPPVWDDLQRHIRCPQCGHDMETHLYGGPGNVVIDSCEQCDLNWLDPGELMRIIRAPDKHYVE